MNTLNIKIRNADNLIKYYNETKVQYEGYFLMVIFCIKNKFKTMNLEVTNLNKDMCELKEEVNKIKNGINENLTQFKNHGNIFIEDGIVDLEQIINKFQLGNDIIEKDLKINEYLIHRFVNFLIDNDSKLGKIIMAKYKGKFNENRILSTNKKNEEFLLSFTNNSEINPSISRFIFGIILNFQHFLLFLYFNYLTNYCYQKETINKTTKIFYLDKEYIDEMCEMSHNLFIKNLDVKKKILSKNFDILNLNMGKAEKVNRSQRKLLTIDKSKYGSLITNSNFINSTKDDLSEVSENSLISINKEHLITDKPVKQIKKYKIKNEKILFFTRVNDINKLKINLFNPQIKRSIGNVYLEIKKKMYNLINYRGLKREVN